MAESGAAPVGVAVILRRVFVASELVRHVGSDRRRAAAARVSLPLGEHYLSVPPTADAVTVVAAGAPLPDAVSVDLARLDAARLRMLTEQ